MSIELNYQQKGGATSYAYEKDYDVSYKLKANYLAIRVPLFWYMTDNYKISPYLFIAPEFAYAYSGNISLSQQGLPISDVSVKINDSNINRIYFGIIGGAGLRKNVYLHKWILVLKTDVAINWGLTNTYAYSETNETATPTNIHAYNNQGKRYSLGLEVNLSIAFIRDFVDPVCFHFK